jgi:hypothetical protein
MDKFYLAASKKDSLGGHSFRILSHDSRLKEFLEDGWAVFSLSSLPRVTEVQISVCEEVPNEE